MGNIEQGRSGLAAIRSLSLSALQRHWEPVKWWLACNP